MSQKIKTVREYLEETRLPEINWEETGLLSGLSDSDSVLLKAKIKEIAQIILSMTYDFKPITETLVFPIVRAAFGGHGYLIRDCVVVLKYIDSRVDAMDVWLKTMKEKAYNSIDVDAEFCAIVAEEISNLKL